MQEEDKLVDHPAHYTQGEHEVIELTERLDFCLGNATKYILRAPYKGQEVRDLKKARWYLKRRSETSYGVIVTEDLHKLACSYGNDLLKEVFDCLYYARTSGDLSNAPYKKSVEILTRVIHETELAEVKRELNRCKTELRKAREKMEKEPRAPRAPREFWAPWGYFYSEKRAPYDPLSGPVMCGIEKLLFEKL